MKNLNTYVITCDKTKHVLKATIPLMEKYWNVEKQVKILGFNGEDIVLPKNYEFISIKPKQLSIDDWAKDIYSVIVNDSNEHLIMMLDDVPPLDYINVDIYNMLYEKCLNDSEIVRCALCNDLQFLPCFVTEGFGDHSIIEQSQHSEYRITTQPSIWRKDYLLEILNKSTNPWQFETAHPSKDGKRIIGTRGKYACCCMGETMLSNRYPGMYNILGLKLSDVKWLVELGAIPESNLQWGQYLGTVPQFSKYGYDFKLETLKKYKGNDDNSPYNYYLAKYGQNYNQ